MISQAKNRVQTIKSKFENLGCDPAVKQPSQLFKLKNDYAKDKENSTRPYNTVSGASDVETSASSNDSSPEPNRNYLLKSDVKRTVSEPKPSLSRQSSDPGKKLHRSHAFRCDRTLITSPSRSGSCKIRPESLKMDRKLSKDRLKKLGDILDVQMKKENFKIGDVVGEVRDVSLINSIPDKNVPAHILMQYAQVIKPKKEDKSEAMTDSGVSSETENLEEDKGQIKKKINQFESDENQVCNEKTEIVEGNLDVMGDLAGSSETMKLERKNPHMILTDTLKKALKQPLPSGPPPKKPPRAFIPTIPENEKKDTKRKLEKLEQVLMKRETVSKKDTNIYDIAEENLSLKKPKEVHYLCTEILDITQRTLLPNQNESTLRNCFERLNCTTFHNSMSSLPYTRLSTELESNRNSLKNCCSCSNNNVNIENSLINKTCVKCKVNEDIHDQFKCHLDCRCRYRSSEFYVDEHIYDEPCVSDVKQSERRSTYGTINATTMLSKSMEDMRGENQKEDPIYEAPSEQRPSTPDPTSPKMPKTEFQKLLHNFEVGVVDKPSPKEKLPPAKLSPKSLDAVKFLTKFEEASDAKLALSKRSPKTSEAVKFQPKFEESPIVKLTPSKLSPKALEAVKFLPTLDEGREGKYLKNEMKYHTEVKRYKPERNQYSLPRKNPQLNVDRENLNALMNEIYETVTAACNMEDNKPGSFPTDNADGGSSEESVKLTRSLTEKRKNYVRRMSSRVAYLEPKSIKPTRRHQTSVCSYKSDVSKSEFDNPYSTFRSWKCFRASQNNLTGKMDTDSKFNLTDSTGNILSLKNDFDVSDGSIDTMSIDEKAGCVDIELPFEPREQGLFNVCLLVGLNYMTAQAYVKSVFPCQVQVPQHIENLIFPETLSQDKGEWSADAKYTQCYSFVLTDERGERSYGYCRRVLPEGATACLPLCYCLIGKYRAPGFYYKVLQEIESHHGGSETEINSVLQQLFESDFPNPGEEITLTIDPSDNDSDKAICQTCDKCKDDCSDKCKVSDNTDKCESDNKESCDTNKCTVNDLSDTSKASNDNEKCKASDSCKVDRKDNGSVKCKVSGIDKCKERDKCKTMPDMRMPEKLYDIENNNSFRELLLSLDGVRVKTISRPLEPRAEESSSCELLDSLGGGLLVKVFGSLLLERKLIVRSDKLSALSSWLEALQAALYPFVWQQPLISCVPAEIQRAVMDAPLPILAGMLDKADIEGDGIEEGMFIDLTHPSKVLCFQGDESTILPTNSYKTLKTSLHMESIKNKDRDDTKTRNVMISEAFLRFFVDILGDFWRFFSLGVLKDGDMGKGDVIFDKDSFIKNATSKQNQYFLEWFTETAMFNHFIQNMAVRFKQTDPESYKQTDSFKSTELLIDTPTPNFYQLFEERISSRRTRANVDRSGYKNALNKRVKLLKARLKDLVG